MRVKFESKEYRWLAVRESPDRASRMVRKIETGLDFEVDGMPENGWYRVTQEPQGYVMAEFVEPTEFDEAADYLDYELPKMTVKELKELAKNSGVALKAGMSKAQIIEALLNGE